MVRISFDKSTLYVDVQGMDRLWAFKRHLEIPLCHVKSVQCDPENPPRTPWIRLLGTHLPGVVTAGTYYAEHKLRFWDVHDATKAVVIDLDDERYAQLVVEVADPVTCVRQINTALAANAR